MAAWPELQVRILGRADYAATFRAMQEFTAGRTPSTPDELWLVEHPPVYTMGLKGRGQRYAPIQGIPVVQTDRGGDMTYHGPGQVVVYLLLDLTRLGLGPKALVHRLEQSVIDLLAARSVTGQRRPGAPGVYVAQAKIAALGLRVRHGCSYHGLALNVDMDLAPFSRIAPCGYAGLDTTQLVDLGLPADLTQVGTALLEHLRQRLGYTAAALQSVAHHG
jgi:lipoyl(octanoyl) transferase